MRIPILVIIGLVCAAHYCCAEESRAFEHDFGIISVTAVVSYTFVLSEEIKSVVTLCDCVKASVVKIATTAGKRSSSVLVELDPTSYQGPLSQEVLLVDKDNKRITLRLKAFVR